MISFSFQVFNPKLEIFYQHVTFLYFGEEISDPTVSLLTTGVIFIKFNHINTVLEFFLFRYSTSFHIVFSYGKCNSFNSFL